MYQQVVRGTEEDEELLADFHGDPALMEGLGGNDYIRGSWNSDLIYGGDGNDNIAAQSGDRAYGGAGDDYLSGAAYSYLNGGSGNDTYAFYFLHLPNITVEDESGIDTFDFGASFYPAQYSLPTAIENVSIDFGMIWKLQGNEADNQISLTQSGESDGYAWIYGHGGDDIIKIALYFFPSHGDFEFGGRVYGGDGNDTIYGYGFGEVVSGMARKNGDAHHYLYGEAGNDVLKGGNGDDRLDGGVGNDNCYGGTENDYILGGAGNDFLRGDHGDDRLVGGRDNDRLEGGAGSDTFIFSGNFGRDRIRDFDVSGGDILQFENVFADFNDLMNHAKQSVSDVRIALDSTHSVVLENVQVVDLTVSGFLFL